MPKLQGVLINLRVSEASDETEEQLSSVLDLTRVTGLDAARAALERRSFDVAFLDFDHPQRFMLTGVGDLKRDHPSVPMVMLTVEHSEDLVLWAFRTRLWEFLCKPVSRAELRSCVDALEEVAAKRRAQQSRSVLSRQRESNALDPASGELRLLKAIYYVEQHYREDIKSRDMAELCNVSPFHFSRLFKDRFGIGFREYVLGRRLAEARKLLAREGCSVSTVAYATGFNDPAYFSRAFKRQFGHSPSDVVGVPAPTNLHDSSNSSLAVIRRRSM